MKKLQRDDIWLMEEIVSFLEKHPERQRFSKMPSKEFTHALFLVYGTYLINQERTGKRIIT